ncbi:MULTISPECIES: glycosyltransferase family 4 protein [Paenarthrobacter]|uniref:glycosyltransferase family 4 protein n=1 Tax=Paenarthrobacter TaxID=1742992 RepID=UPI00074D3C06|nr:glycosyltransferase family 4 protein [Paenarthrobacter ureafaciens]AMB40616.1 group 1 glycosyl transferase [Arthrobacter sp. ATCC 21022]KUR63948.1 group 1 glycosyl transferase [Arthrobacter sp. ATCC 21022]RWW98962.1 glycosyltransferase [Paenarthrobacter ureafaciens]
MRILIYPHDLGLGGSQLNAIELGAAVQALGHDVVLFGQPGALVRHATELGLDYVEAPLPGKRPSPRVVRALAKTVRERRIEVLHGYEWPPALECLAAARLVPGTTAVSTVMSMAVAPFIPYTMPLVVGTEQIRQVETAAGRRRVALMEPPVDTSVNSVATVSAATVGGGTFRSHWGLGDDALAVVCVTRLAQELKLEGILAAMESVRALSREWPVRLIIAGSGPAAEIVHHHARRINDDAGRRLVILTGELADPRPAYAAADVVLGMGGSALRGLAFGKPLVVQGEQGFWELLTPETLPTFLWQGWYGSGPGTTGEGIPALTAILARLFDDPDLRRALGSLGRNVVEDRFSLSGAAERQVELYGQFTVSRPGAAEAARAEAVAFARYCSYVAARRWQRLTGRAATDDFNARPVAAAHIHVPAVSRP